MMGLQDIFLGTFAGDNTGTPGRDCFDRINQNNATIEAAMEDAELKAFVVKLFSKDDLVEAEDSKEWWRQPYAFVVLEVRAATFSSGADDVVIDIRENGSSILDSNLLEVPAGATTSVGFSPQALPYPVILSDNARMDIDVVSVGISGAQSGAPSGLEVTLIGYVIWVTS
jgi:hypothetical protein